MEQHNTEHVDLRKGRPLVSPPEVIPAAIDQLLSGDPVALHGYTTAAGRLELRQVLAHWNRRLDLVPERIYVTCGGAAALAILLRAILPDGGAVAAVAPCSPIYQRHVTAAGGTFSVAPPTADFQPDPEALAQVLRENTCAVILSIPNNHTGVIPSAETLKALADVVRRQAEKNGKPIYVICDEPFRELVYDGAAVPEIAAYYDDVILCDSFSASLAIPGERMGFLAVGPKAAQGDLVYAAILGAGRAMGYVNPPGLFQRVLEQCPGASADFTPYAEHRDTLLNGLQALGYSCVPPQAGYYLFAKAPGEDCTAFCRSAAAEGLDLVPGVTLGCPGWFRAAFSVPQADIERALQVFQTLWEKR